MSEEKTPPPSPGHQFSTPSSASSSTSSLTRTATPDSSRGRYDPALRRTRSPTPEPAELTVHRSGVTASVGRRADRPGINHSVRTSGGKRLLPVPPVVDGTPRNCSTGGPNPTTSTGSPRNSVTLGDPSPTASSGTPSRSSAAASSGAPRSLDFSSSHFTPISAPGSGIPTPSARRQRPSSARTVTSTDSLIPSRVDNRGRQNDEPSSRVRRSRSIGANEMQRQVRSRQSLEDSAGEDQLVITRDSSGHHHIGPVMNGGSTVMNGGSAVNGNATNGNQAELKRNHSSGVKMNINPNNILPSKPKVISRTHSLDTSPTDADPPERAMFSLAPSYEEYPEPEPNEELNQRMEMLFEEYRKVELGLPLMPHGDTPDSVKEEKSVAPQRSSPNTHKKNGTTPNRSAGRATPPKITRASSVDMIYKDRSPSPIIYQKPKSPSPTKSIYAQSPQRRPGSPGPQAYNGSRAASPGPNRQMARSPSVGNIPKSAQQARPASPATSRQSRQASPAPSSQTRPASPAPSRQLRSPSPAPSRQSRPASPAPSTQTRPASPAPSRQSRTAGPASSTQARPESPGPSRQSRPAGPAPSNIGRPESPCPARQSRGASPAPSRISRPASPAPARQSQPVTPTPSRVTRPASPGPSQRPASPGPSQRPASSGLSQRPASPGPSRQSRPVSPAPSRLTRPESPAPSRQPPPSRLITSSSNRRPVGSSPACAGANTASGRASPAITRSPSPAAITNHNNPQTNSLTQPQTNSSRGSLVRQSNRVDADEQENTDIPEFSSNQLTGNEHHLPKKSVGGSPSGLAPWKSSTYNRKTLGNSQLPQEPPSDTSHINGDISHDSDEEVVLRENGHEDKASRANGHSNEDKPSGAVITKTAWAENSVLRKPKPVPPKAPEPSMVAVSYDGAWDTDGLEADPARQYEAPKQGASRTPNRTRPSSARTVCKINTPVTPSQQLSRTRRPASARAKPIERDTSTSRDKTPVSRTASSPVGSQAVIGRRPSTPNMRRSGSQCGSREDLLSSTTPSRRSGSREDLLSSTTPSRRSGSREDLLSSTTPSRRSGSREDLLSSTTPSRRSGSREDLLSSTTTPSRRSGSREDLLSTTPSRPLTGQQRASSLANISKSNLSELTVHTDSQSESSSQDIPISKFRKDDRQGRTRIPLPSEMKHRMPKDTHDSGSELKRFDSGVDINNPSPTENGVHSEDEHYSLEPQTTRQVQGSDQQQRVVEARTNAQPNYLYF